MNTPPYQQALERIRADYVEMPGMRLRPEQVERLCGVDRSVCRQVLDALVSAKFLYLGPDGSYARLMDSSPLRLRTAKADWSAGVRPAATRRAG